MELINLLIAYFTECTFVYCLQIRQNKHKTVRVSFVWTQQYMKPSTMINK